MIPVPIQINRCWPTTIGLELPDDLEIKEWREIGEGLMRVETAYQFLIGDWLNFGERKYGEKYTVAVDEMGLNYGTLRNWASVCGRIELSRRNDKLKFSHHEAIAKEVDSPKDQNKWIAKAAEHSWSVEDLREAIRKGRAQYAKEDHGAPVKTFAGALANTTRLLNQNAVAIQTMQPEERANLVELLRPVVEFSEKVKAVECGTETTALGQAIVISAGPEGIPGNWELAFVNADKTHIELVRAKE